jgi:hypothetical protein
MEQELLPSAALSMLSALQEAPTTQERKHAELKGTTAEKPAFVFRQLAALVSHHQNQFQAHSQQQLFRR